MYITIPGFEKLTEQQCFDMAARHIMKTRQKCMSPVDGQACSYQGVGCAASVFLKPEHRAEADVSGTWYGLITDGKASNDNYNLIVRLQVAHDHTTDNFMEQWKASMQRIATDFKLDPAELTR